MSENIMNFTSKLKLEFIQYIDESLDETICFIKLFEDKWLFVIDRDSRIVIFDLNINKSKCYNSSSHHIYDVFNITDVIKYKNYFIMRYDYKGDIFTQIIDVEDPRQDNFVSKKSDWINLGKLYVSNNMIILKQKNYHVQVIISKNEKNQFIFKSREIENIPSKLYDGRIILKNGYKRGEIDTYKILLNRIDPESIENKPYEDLMLDNYPWSIFEYKDKIVVGYDSCVGIFKYKEYEKAKNEYEKLINKRKRELELYLLHNDNKYVKIRKTNKNFKDRYMYRIYRDDNSYSIITENDMRDMIKLYDRLSLINYSKYFIVRCSKARTSLKEYSSRFFDCYISSPTDNLINLFSINFNQRKSHEEIIEYDLDSEVFCISTNAFIHSYENYILDNEAFDMEHTMKMIMKKFKYIIKLDHLSDEDLEDLIFSKLLPENIFQDIKGKQRKNIKICPKQKIEFNNDDWCLLKCKQILYYPEINQVVFDWVLVDSWCNIHKNDMDNISLKTLERNNEVYKQLFINKPWIKSFNNKRYVYQSFANIICKMLVYGRNNEDRKVFNPKYAAYKCEKVLVIDIYDKLDKNKKYDYYTHENLTFTKNKMTRDPSFLYDKNKNLIKGIITYFLTERVAFYEFCPLDKCCSGRFYDFAKDGQLKARREGIKNERYGIWINWDDNQKIDRIYFHSDEGNIIKIIKKVRDNYKETHRENKNPCYYDQKKIKEFINYDLTEKKLQEEFYDELDFDDEEHNYLFSNYGYIKVGDHNICQIGIMGQNNENIKDSFKNYYNEQTYLFSTDKARILSIFNMFTDKKVKETKLKNLYKLTDGTIPKTIKVGDIITCDNYLDKQFSENGIVYFLSKKGAYWYDFDCDRPINYTGIKLKYYLHGILASKSNYVDGILEGEVIHYDIAGNPIRSFNLKNGKKQGKCMIYKSPVSSKGVEYYNKGVKVMENDRILIENGLIGYKKLKDDKICKILSLEKIPLNYYYDYFSKVSSSKFVSFKCSKALVLDICNMYNEDEKFMSGVSLFDINFDYIVDEEISIKNHDCQDKGIYFFLSKEVAFYFNYTPPLNFSGCIYKYYDYGLISEIIEYKNGVIIYNRSFVPSYKISDRDVTIVVKDGKEDRKYITNIDMWILASTKTHFEENKDIRFE